MTTAKRRGRPPKVETITAKNEEAAKELEAWVSPAAATDEVRNAARALLNARMGAYGDEVRGENLAPEFQRILERIARK